MVYSEKLVKRYRELHQESPDCLLLMQVGAGLMKIAIYFSEKLIPFLFRLLVIGQQKSKKNHENKVTLSVVDFGSRMD